MIRITKKDMRIMTLLNEFGFLDEEFFTTLFHSRSTLVKAKDVYKVRICLNKLIEVGFVSTTESHDGVAYYSLTSSGGDCLFLKGEKIYPNNLVINSGKFFHSRLCSHLYAKISASYRVNYLSENSLLRMSNSEIIPDLAIKLNETVIYFEVERSLKSEALIKEKLSSYNSNFKDGYLIYLTESDSIIKKIDRLKHAYSSSKRIMAFSLKSFMESPANYLKDIKSFSITGNVNEVSTIIH